MEELFDSSEKSANIEQSAEQKKIRKNRKILLKKNSRTDAEIDEIEDQKDSADTVKEETLYSKTAEVLKNKGTGKKENDGNKPVTEANPEQNSSYVMINDYDTDLLPLKNNDSAEPEDKKEGEGDNTLHQENSPETHARNTPSKTQLRRYEPGKSKNLKYTDTQAVKNGKSSDEYGLAIDENDMGDFEEDIKSENYKLINPKIYINEFLKMDFPQIISYAKDMGIKQSSKLSKQDLIYKIMQIHNKLGGTTHVNGVLEIKKPFGFIRYSNYSYFESADDIYVDPGLISQYSLKTGDSISGVIRAPRSNGGKYFEMVKIDRVNDEDNECCKTRIAFENLTPIYPDRKINLEFMPEKYATRILNIFAPIGTGQRGLIVAPPKAGKTVILQEIANAINQNHPDFYVIILLIDERPEEVTDMKENVPSAEVIASTFDEQPERHVKVAELVIEKARRLVEHKKNVVILLDSITRLARAYNLVCQTSGKVLSGGVDANALYGPKKFFGAARNIRDGGSLTIIATALVETGSKMDDVIFEEFKGTGNMELNLLRKLADRRIFPAIDLVKSSTRKEELLLDEDTKSKSWILRKVLSEMDEIDAMTKVLEKLKKSKTNMEFLSMLSGN